MTTSSRSVLAAAGGFALLLSQASAAPVPVAAGAGIDAASTPVELAQHRGGPRGGMGPRGMGPRGMGPRGMGPRGFGPRYGGRGPGWGRPLYWGAPALLGGALYWGAPGYYDDCLRQGWVWNGYRYAWRNYRIC